MEMGKAMYSQGGAAGAGPEADAAGGPGADGAAGGADDNVVDAEFTDAGDDNK